VKGTFVRPGLAGAQSWLLSFSVVLVLAANSGGYWPTTWGWGTLVLSLVGGLALVLRDEIHLSVLEKAAALALLAFTAWGALSMLWAPSATQPLLQTQRMLVYVAGVFAALLFTRTGSYRALLAGTWLATTLVSGYSLLTRCFPERLGSIDQLAGYRLSQPLGYWNALGIFSVVGILLALGLAARGRSLVVRALAAGSTRRSYTTPTSASDTVMPSTGSAPRPCSASAASASRTTS
jgi:hypothetical protein